MGFTLAFREILHSGAVTAPSLMQHYGSATFKWYPDPSYFLPDPVAARISVHYLSIFSATLKTDAAEPGSPPEPALSEAEGRS
jgi:hypothetical protein